MLTLTGNGHLTRDVELCTTRSGKHVTTVSVASDRRDRQADPLYVDLIVWEGQASSLPRRCGRAGVRRLPGRLVTSPSFASRCASPWERRGPRGRFLA